MPLETGSFISDLNTANPAHTDGLGAADAHLRLIKSLVKGTFPNVTGAITSTHTAIDAAATAVANGVAVLNDSGAFFHTHSTDGVTNPASGEVDLVAAGVAVAKAKSTGLEVPLKVTAGSYAGGNGELIPIGMPLPWLDDTLPAGAFGWLNGGTLVRADNPVLFARWGTTYGAGNGTTTFNVPDWREVTPIGKSTMGGTSARNLVTQYQGTGAGKLGTLGSVVGENTHTLTEAELPALTKSLSLVNSLQYDKVSFGGITFSPGAQNFASASNPSSLAGSLSGTVSFGSGNAHNIVQPSVVCNWVIRIG